MSPSSPAFASERRTRLMLVEGHAIFREVMHHLFSRSAEFVLSHAVSSLREAEYILERERIDIVLLEIMLYGENIVSRIDDLVARFPASAILVFSSVNDAAVVREVMDRGAMGFLSKYDGKGEFFNALRCVRDRKPFISRRVQSPATGVSRAGDATLSIFSRREKELLREIAAGRPVREIARRLGISPKTVERHKENLKEKLNLSSAAALLREAIRIFPVEGM